MAMCDLLRRSADIVMAAHWCMLLRELRILKSEQRLPSGGIM
jgi:hypothetical protein